MKMYVGSVFPPHHGANLLGLRLPKSATASSVKLTVLRTLLHVNIKATLYICNAQYTHHLEESRAAHSLCHCFQRFQISLVRL